MPRSCDEPTAGSCESSHRSRGPAATPSGRHRFRNRSRPSSRSDRCHDPDPSKPSRFRARGAGMRSRCRLFARSADARAASTSRAVTATWPRSQHTAAAIEYGNAVKAKPELAEAHYKLAKAYEQPRVIRVKAYGAVRAGGRSRQPSNMDAQLQAGALLLSGWGIRRWPAHARNWPSRRNRTIPPRTSCSATRSPV